MNPALTKADADFLMRLAIGRLFLLGSRPPEPGDAEAYSRLRSIVLDCGEVLGIDSTDRRPNYARDRLRGAAGD